MPPTDAVRHAQKVSNERTTPVSRFLAHCISAFVDEHQGRVASYIPELTKANPAHFGVALATTDGHLYAVGDSDVPFTIQSISKAFVFAVALETLGAQRVEAKIGVEPSGEAFNSIRLRPDNRPFNPMVNAGAIACSGLIVQAEGGAAADSVIRWLGRFAGRTLSVDEAVFNSERETGDRNRAIAYLLRNYSIVEGDVAAVLDVYFRQCSVLVTAQDLAVMAATLANGGVNPRTGERVISPYVVARTLSVMTSSGMYDFAGEWTYRVGIPAKSGVGGGILAALPSQLGLGTFSPRLDEYGNSVRGLMVCEALSKTFGLHLLNRSGDVRASVVADYSGARVSSQRMRQPHEQAILNAHADEIRVLELAGALTFAAMDYVSRRLDFTHRSPEFLIIDFGRVPTISEAAAAMLGDLISHLSERRATTIISGVSPQSALAALIDRHVRPAAAIRSFPTLDMSIEWAEDQVIYRYGGFTDLADCADLSGQDLLSGLTPEEIEELAKFAASRVFMTGERIIAAGEAAVSLFFLQSGMVSVKLGNGARLASLVPGVAFGEMALIEGSRLADVWADSPVRCLELPIGRLEAFRERYPRAGERIMRNLAVLFSRRLAVANARIELLSGH